MGNNEVINYKHLYSIILEGIFSKKGQDVIEVNLEKTDNSICKSFIICHADSTTQVRAIAESVEKKVKTEIGLNAWHKEGFENQQWILIDYFDIIVHVFLKPFRTYYNLEELWADGKIVKLEDEGEFLKKH